MALEKERDYLWVEKVDMNEGLASGTVSKGALFGTKQALYYLPQSAVTSLGMTTTVSDGRQQQARVSTALLARLAEPDGDLQAIEAWLSQELSVLTPRRVYPLDELSVFRVQVGFWIFGGVTLKHREGARQTLNVQPRAVRERMAAFYEGKLR